MAELPPYVSRDLVAERLPLIFPEGTPNRTYCVRELAASTVFAMLYIGAIEGTGRYLGPVHVYRMTEEQAGRSSVDARLNYASDVLTRKYAARGTRWYADNTREPIRDETLREDLVAVGAVSARTDLPTTSSRPRYALRASQAALEADSRPLWHMLLKELRPQIVALSAAERHLERIKFPALTEWQILHAFKKTGGGDPRSRPYELRARWYEVGGEQVLFVFGQAAQKPFGALHHTQKRKAGAIALEAYKKGPRHAEPVREGSI